MVLKLRTHPPMCKSTSNLFFPVIYIENKKSNWDHHKIKENGDHEVHKKLIANLKPILTNPKTISKSWSIEKEEMREGRHLEREIVIGGYCANRRWKRDRAASQASLKQQLGFFKGKGQEKRW